MSGKWQRRKSSVHIRDVNVLGHQRVIIAAIIVRTLNRAVWIMSAAASTRSVSKG